MEQAKKVKKDFADNQRKDTKCLVDTGKDSMYDRLVKASQAREGIFANDFDKYKQIQEDRELQKLVNQNKIKAVQE